MNKTIFVALLLFISCSKEIPFDKELWNERSDVFYDYREYMINDLAQNHLHSEMSYSEVLNLLGKPTIYETQKMKES